MSSSKAESFANATEIVFQRYGIPFDEALDNFKHRDRDLEGNTIISLGEELVPHRIKRVDKTSDDPNTNAVIGGPGVSRVYIKACVTIFGFQK